MKRFIVVASSALFLSSCGAADKVGLSGSRAKSNPVPYVPPTVAQNTAYTAPTVGQAPPQNYVPSLPSNISSNTKVSWNRANVVGKYVALTFDDGPVAANTTRLLNMLKQRNIKATFYVVGTRVHSNASVMRRIVAEGHEVGNHTWSHSNLAKMSDSGVRSELSKTRDAIIQTTGIKPRTMRPPYGAITSRQKSWIFSEFGYPTILWDVDPEDWKKPGAGVIKSRITSNTQSGSIILLHDLHMSSVDAVPATVDDLLRRGYKFVTVSQLIAMSR